MATIFETVYFKNTLFLGDTNDLRNLAKSINTRFEGVPSTLYAYTTYTKTSDSFRNVHITNFLLGNVDFLNDLMKGLEWVSKPVAPIARMSQLITDAIVPQKGGNGKIRLREDEQIALCSLNYSLTTFLVIVASTAEAKERWFAQTQALEKHIVYVNPSISRGDLIAAIEKGPLTLPHIRPLCGGIEWLGVDQFCKVTLEIKN